ncbi:hypothetical protein SAMN05421541_106403 [Actinoplanes philippinensis]|uniref:Uncharacterized protein n=2 Tax=Actinoplanes philippinensis TaxID=35752 RepID=A0A1I2GDT4_9ACTN|nr:hypothetical protein SAMN05421541_106403 [Actinoplanes philippinensis]
MIAMTTKREGRDHASLQRRLEVLKLPVVPLEHHGFLAPADRAEMKREPETVGVGPDGTAFAVWSHRQNSRHKQVTWHLGGKGIRILGAIDVETDLRVSFVQPLPEGRVLLAAARAGRGELNGEVWTHDGDLEHRGHLGDAIEELQTTASGKVWAGYKVTDWGASPCRSAHSMLVSGADRALLGGWGSEYDVMTLLRVDRDGVRRIGGQCRVVLPDGIEAQRLRYTCRGGDLHGFIRGRWYRTDVDAISAAAGSTGT